MSPISTALLGSGAALVYVVATWILEPLGGSPYLILVPVALATVAVAAWLESNGARRYRPRTLVALFVVFEIALAVVAGILSTAEIYPSREVVGALVAFAGLALIGTRSGRAG